VHHSAAVEMYLECGEERLDVWGILEGDVTTKKDVYLVTKIDDMTYRTKVKITVRPCTI